MTRIATAALALAALTSAAQAAGRHELKTQAVCGDSRQPAAARIVACTELADGYAANPTNHAAALYLRGNAKLELKDNAGALADYTASIAAKPDFPEPLYTRGLVRHDAADDDGAIADFDAYLKLKPGDAAAHRDRALAYKAKGDLEKAEKDTQDYLRLSGKAPAPN